MVITSPGVSDEHTLARQHSRQKAKSKQGTAQRVASLPLGHELLAAAERDFERLQHRGNLMGVFRVHVPRSADHECGVNAEVGDGLSGGKAPVWIMGIHAGQFGESMAATSMDTPSFLTSVLLLFKCKTR